MKQLRRLFSAQKTLLTQINGITWSFIAFQYQSYFAGGTIETKEDVNQSNKI
jgi:hypothetical protein